MKSEPEDSAERRLSIPPLVLLILGGLVAALGFRALSRSLHAKGFTSVDTRRSCVVALDEGAALATWIDPRWERLLSRDLAALADVSSFDGEAFDALVREIEARPFVAEVGRANILWPDGMSIEIRFERPVACLGVDGEFLTVSSGGIVLPGPWPMPPEIDAAPLPILAGRGYSREELRPGVPLTSPELYDALVVANSMEEYLPVSDRRELGPLVIDASRAEQASLEVPGIVLDLEYGRRILFGRAPGGAAPGELPAAAKWNSVSRGVEGLRTGLDWQLLDVRWDEPRYVTRDGEEGSL